MKNKKFYFDFEYFPEISYESYILKFFVDGKDLCELKNEKYKYDKLGDIYFTAYLLKDKLDKILNEPFPDKELKIKKDRKDTAIELVKKANELYKDVAFNLDSTEFWLLYEWAYNHQLPQASGEIYPRVFFSAIGNKIEITWESDREFKNRKGVYYIPKKLLKMKF